MLSALASLALATLLAQAAPEAGVFDRHAVASDQAVASEAGAAILAQGGNAADAAAATMLALGTSGPGSSGLGGGGFALYWRAGDRTLHYLDFRERAPAAATPVMFARREGDTDEQAEDRSRAGGLAVAVPGEPAGIEMLIARFGSQRVTRAQIAAPAIRLASEGAPAGAEIERFTRWLGASLRRDPVFGAWFPRGQDFVPAGTPLRNEAHARTLRIFASHGAEPFYRGAIAREIVRRVREQGGILTAEDLAQYAVREREPMLAERLGYRWAVAPPPSAGGYTLLASLGLLERWVPSSLRSRDSAFFRHALAESWKGPYTERFQYLGDPDHVAIPIEALLARERTEARARVFHPTLARATSRYDLPRIGEETRAAVPGGDAGTSHLCVVDEEGNVAAITTTVNLPFGARFTAAGVVMNDEMDDFAREVGQPNAFGLVGGAPNLPGPGRRPVSSMSPTIVFDREMQPILCIGAAGGSRIITATEQVALFVLLFGDTPAQAMERRRVHHQGVPASLSVEQGLDEAIVAELRARGHAITDTEHSAVVQAIRIRHDGGRRRLYAASDPRKGGRPAGR